MRSSYRVGLMVLAGVVGGYVGYWLGHLAGWSVDAEWPLRIGGGAGAIALSIALAVVAVMVTGWLVRPHHPTPLGG